MKRSFLAVAASLASALLVQACSASASADDSPFWVNPDSRAARQAVAWEERGRRHEAALLRRIAEQPTATWISGGGRAEEQVRTITEAAARQGRLPVLAAYNIPHRDCGLYSSGGARDADAYREWIRAVAAGIGDRRAVVVLEPDAVPQIVAGCGIAGHDGETARLRLLKEAVSTLGALPGVRLYLDAGNPGWIPDPDRVAAALKAAGVDQADGFALNVSNFHTTRANETYGDALSTRLGGAHYVIDTSRNGNGPWEHPSEAETWCNPPGRALGVPPTTRTDDPLVDAYLWVKRPGESDGACRGAPPAGQWWTDYAVGLAARAEAARAEGTRPTPHR
jgi:endoglucanase